MRWLNYTKNDKYFYEKMIIIINNIIYIERKSQKNITK